MDNRIFNNTDKRRWWKYEELQIKWKAKTQSRLVLPSNHADKFIDFGVLFFTKIYLLLRRVIMYILTPIIIMLASFWLSGFLAAQRQSFWSLLAAVIGTIVALILVNVKDKK